MKYSVTIDPKILDGKLTLDSELITSVEYVASPKENEHFGTYRRSLSVVVNGVLNSHETKTIEVLRWIETQDKYHSFCCALELEIKDENDTVVRTVSFPTAKVIDYKETFDGQGAKFSFIARQSFYENEEIVIG